MPEVPQPNEPVRVFYSYSHKDGRLRDTLEEHFSLLRRDGVISEWHDRGISAGREWAGEIDEHLRSADIILLLISSSFIASDYCYDVELKLAMERHEAGEARVVPVILRPCTWEKSPFGKLNALPKNAKPVTKWGNRDDAFKDIADGVGLVAEELKAERRGPGVPAAATAGAPPPAASSLAGPLVPRSPSVGFVARRDEQGRDVVERLREELSPDKNRLVALWGPGGAGKTTLAAEVARALGRDYPRRLAWLSALGRTDFGLQTLLDEVATQLGREDLRLLAPDQKAEQLRALLSYPPSLVVLDNFETIGEGERARCVGFLALSTGCSALITTRVRVDHADVKNVRLGSMEAGDAREFWRRLVEQSGRPSAFEGLDADDIIRRCEANPLVMQWVIGQIELAQRPRDALAYLYQGQGDAAERVFDRSFNLPQLGDDGRAALLALSLFTPDASRESLAEVSGFGDDLNRLNGAVRNMSALWLVETTGGNERLFLRALKRELAKSRLSKDERADEFRGRYVAHFMSYAQAHAEATPENFDALEAEKENLRGAMDVAFESGDLAGVMFVSDRLCHFLRLRGYWDEAIRSAERGEDAARQANDDSSAAVFMSNVATIRKNRGEYAEAEAIYRNALEIFRGEGVDNNVAVALHQLGTIAEARGDLAGARQYYEESLQISKSLDAPSLVASTTSQIGILHLHQGELEKSRAMHEESLAIRRELGEQQGMAIDLSQLGQLALVRKDFAEARRHLDESLKLSRQLGDGVQIAITLYHLAGLAKEGGDKAEAAPLYREALHIYESLGSPNADFVREELARVEGLID
jgi:tetratricopeptide (TPR) repeat protein